MSTADIFLNVFMAITVVLQCINGYLVNSKRMVIYPLGISIYLGYLIVEAWIAVRDVSIAAIGLFVLVDLVWIFSALHGWRKHGKAIQSIGEGKQ